VLHCEVNQLHTLLRHCLSRAAHEADAIFHGSSQKC
jgi:hypothetical protein